MVCDHAGATPFDDIPETGTLMQRSSFQLCRTRSGFRPPAPLVAYAICNFILHIATKIVTSFRMLKNYIHFIYLYLLQYKIFFHILLSGMMHALPNTEA